MDLEFFNKYRKYILIIITVLLLIMVIPWLFKFTLEDLLAYKPQSLILTALLLWGVYCIKAVTMVIPITVLYVAAGLLFPGKWGILITYIGLIIEISIGYKIGKQMGSERVSSLINNNKTAAKFFNRNKKFTGINCFIIRILPLPFDIVNLYFGAVNMPYQSYILFSLLGITPFMVLTVLASHSMFNPLSPDFLIPFSIYLIFAVVIYLLFRWWQNKRTDDQEDIK